MMTSRGCPFKCTYCADSIFGKKYLVRSPGSVVDELEYIIEEYNVQEIHFYDDDFTIDMKRAAQICDEIIRRKVKISWSCMIPPTFVASLGIFPIVPLSVVKILLFQESMLRLDRKKYK